MATYYVWSGSGAEASPYDTWEKAAHNLSTVDGLAAAGETIYVAHDHSETAAGQSLVFTNGTQAAPIRVVCGTRTGTGSETGISALATTGKINSSTTTFSCNTGSIYVYGVEFEGTVSGTLPMVFANTSSVVHVYEQCKFLLAGATNSSSRINFGLDSATTHPYVILKNCQFKLNNSSQNIGLSSWVKIIGGSFTADSVNPNVFCTLSQGNRGAVVDIGGFDFSELSSTLDLVGSGSSGGYTARFRNCKMPSAWSGDLWNAVPSGGGARIELLNYGAGDTNYKYWIHDARGSCKDNTTVYRTAGAADESSQNYSIEMVSTANVSWPGHALRSPPILVRVGSTGSKTFTVHIANNTAALTNIEVWAEVEYLGTSGFPLSLFATDTLDILSEGNATAQTNVGSGWTGSPTYMQSLDVTATIEEKGYAIVTVCLGKPSATIYADWKVVVS